METRKLVGGWVQSLGEMVKTPLKLQDDGVCAIAYGDGRVCAIEVPEDDGPIVVHAPVVAMSGSAREAIYAKALALNLYGAGTGGLTLALDEASDKLVLCASRGASSLDATSFAGLVGSVIITAVRLSGELSEANAAAPAPSPVADAMSAFVMRV